MLEYRDGNSVAFDVLYARHKGGLYRYILRQCHQQTELANELFQDVWMKIINSRDSYEVSARFNTYLYRIAYHRMIDYWRAAQRRGMSETYDDEKQQGGDTPAENIEQLQKNEQLKKAIYELPEEQRQAILLKEESSLSLLEIADITGVDRETVKSRLRYAMKRLRIVLQPLRSVS